MGNISAVCKVSIRITMKVFYLAKSCVKKSVTCSNCVIGTLNNIANHGNKIQMTGGKEAIGIMRV